MEGSTLETLTWREDNIKADLEEKKHVKVWNFFTWLRTESNARLFWTRYLYSSSIGSTKFPVWPFYFHSLTFPWSELSQRRNSSSLYLRVPLDIPPVNMCDEILAWSFVFYSRTLFQCYTSSNATRTCTWMVNLAMPPCMNYYSGIRLKEQSKSL